MSPVQAKLVYDHYYNKLSVAKDLWKCVTGPAGAFYTVIDQA